MTTTNTKTRNNRLPMAAVTLMILTAFPLVSAFPSTTGTRARWTTVRVAMVDEADATRRSILLGAPAAMATTVLVPRSSGAATATTTRDSGSITLPGHTTADFPVASFGLQVYDNDVAYRLTLIALAAGYRNFFASVLAGNQKGFAKAVRASGVPRSELYICGTVLSNRAKGEEAAYKATQKGCAENMREMAYGGIDYLDMIMLDYPGPDADSVRGQWRAFEDFHHEGKVKDLAVSNFDARQLDVLLNPANNFTIKPCLNQLPFSLANKNPTLLAYNQARGVAVQSWSPLSRVLRNPTLRPVLAEVGSKYGKSPAQVALRWIVQSGATFCTQSSNKEHFVEDLNVFDFALSGEEMARLTSA